MKYTFLVLILCLSIIACGPQVTVVKTDQLQYRRTLKDDIRQLNFNLILELDKKNTQLDVSELDVSLNDIYLGKAVIGGASQAIESQRYRLPVRVTFPTDILVLLDENEISVDGFLMLNGKKTPIQFKEKAVRVNNMTAL